MSTAAIKAVPAIELKSTRFYVFRWKEQLDRDAPAWKKLFFWFVYRPFNQFCRFRLGLPTFNAEECCGCGKRLLWTEHESIQRERWQAIQACKTREWGYHALPYETETSGKSRSPLNHNYPLTDARTQEKYRRNGHSMVEVPRADVMRLIGKIAQSDHLVEQYKSKAT